MIRLEAPTAAALTGLATYQLYQAYTTTAPSLSDLRNTHGDSTSARQALLDADLMVGGLAVLVGGMTALLSRRPEPLFLVIVGLAFVSYYHHAVLASATPSYIDENGKGIGDAQ